MSAYRIGGHCSFAHVVSGLCKGEGCRPVAVVDPEDVTAVGNLVNFFAFQDQAGMRSGPIPRMQAALREFAAPTPPRPVEPQGFGAVIEDAEGLRWVRANRIRKFPWETRGKDGGYTWAGVDAVRVLSEGVS